MRSHPTPRTGKAIGFPVLLILIFTALSLPSAGAATLVFNWGGDYISEYTPFTVTPVTPAAPGQIDYRYSSTVPIGTAGGKLYGAFLIEEAGSTPTFSTFGYTASDSIAVGTTADSGERTMRGLFYFTREDFLVSGTAPITFNTTSRFSYNVVSSGGSSSGGSLRHTSMLVHALVDGEWNWYVSPGRNTGTTFVTLDSLGTVEWLPYSFSADAPLAAAPTGTETVQGSLFEDIGAVGIYFNYKRVAAVSGGRNMSFYVNQLSLTAEAIPEPSVVLLAGAGLVLLGAGWFRRRSGAVRQ